MENSKWITYWRIAPTSTLTNQTFFALGLPPPNLPDYKTYSQLVPQSQGGRSRQGYISIKILWDFLDFLQLKTLDGIVEAAITAGIIYATVDKADGTGLLNSFIDIHGVPIPLEFEPISNARGIIFSNVLLTINAVVVDNDPSAVF